MVDRPVREAVMDPNFLQDLEHWTRTNRAMAMRTLSLVDAILRDPFRGIGKPEPLRGRRLRGRLSGKWSRHIDEEHRLVYTVEADRVHSLAARYHY